MTTRNDQQAERQSVMMADVMMVDARELLSRLETADKGRFAGSRWANCSESLRDFVGAKDALENLANRGGSVPALTSIHSAIRDAVEADVSRLVMGAWHWDRWDDLGYDARALGEAEWLEANKSCNTTHCRAGFAVALTGVHGHALEDEWDPATAGALIYLASGAQVPNFYANDEEALADIRRCADEEAAGGPQ